MSINQLDYKTSYYFDVLHNLEFIEQQLLLFDNKAFQHKWLVITIHNLLQSIFVIILKDRSNNFNIATEHSIKKWNKDRANGKVPGLLKIERFEPLAERSLKILYSTEDIEYKKAKDIIEFFNERRNMKIHYIVDSMHLSFKENLDFTLKALRLCETLIKKNSWRIVDLRDGVSSQDYLGILKKLIVKIQLECNKF